MYGIVKKEVLSKEFILERLSQEEIFSWLLGYRPSIGNGQLNTMRGDVDPNCSFEYVNGKLRFRDWANREWSGDCFDCTMMKHNVNYSEALKLINDKFSLEGVVKVKNFNSSKNTKVTSHSEFRFRRRQFKIKDKNYWGKYGITKEQLIKNNVVPIDSAYYKSKYNDEGWAEWKVNNPIKYAYYFPKTKHMKLYAPGNKDWKFFGNTTNEDIYGLDLIPDRGELLVIQGSGKDKMCLENIIDYPVIAQNSESYYLPDNILENLNSRFDEIMLFYDNDKPGKEAMFKQAEMYKCSYFILADGIAKDVSDFYELDKEQLMMELNKANLIK